MSDFDWNAVAPFVVQAREARDRAAFEEIFRRVWEIAFSFVLKHYGRTLTTEDAQDVLMQTFETAWRELPKLRDPLAFGGWFFRILARNCLAACRIRLVTAVLGSSEESGLDALVLLTPELAEEVGAAAGRADPYRHLVRAELVKASGDRIMKVYSKLTARQQMVFEARVLNLFDETESAERIGLPVGTIRGAYAKIVRLLKKEFEAAEFREVPEAERKVAFIEALAGWQQQTAGGWV